DNRVTIAPETEGIPPASGAVYRISGFNWVVGQNGSYQLTVDADGILDLAGNAGSGSASASWVMDTTPPDPASNLAISPDTGVSKTDGITNTGAVTLTGSLDESGLSVHVEDTSTSTDLGYATVTSDSFRMPLQLAPGDHELQLRVVDAAGNVDLASQLHQPASFFDVFVDTTTPAVTVADAILPNPGTTPVSSEDVTFNEPIDVATLLPALSLTLGSNSTNLIGGGVSVAPLPGTAATYEISGLSGLTAALGSYTLTIDATRV